MSEEKKNNNKKIETIRTVLLVILSFTIGFSCGAVCITLLSNNNVPAFVSLTETDENTPKDSKKNENPVVVSDSQSVEITSIETTTTEETTTEETTTTMPMLSTPLGDKYPDMMVEKLPLKEDVEGDKVVYITFDDGPWSGTPELLDLLDEYGVKATFFVTAQYLTGDELIDSLKEIHNRGHELAVHTYCHEYDQIYSSVENYLDDYKLMDDLIIQATGQRSHVFRFPGGSNAKYSAEIRSKLLPEMNGRGFVYHDWNSYDGGCDNYSIDGMISKAVGEASAHDKSVLLMHDTKAQSFILQTLPSIISQLKEQGYRFDKLDATVKPFQFEKVEEESEETTIPETEEVTSFESEETVIPNDNDIQEFEDSLSDENY